MVPPTMVANRRSVTVCMSSDSACGEGCALGMTVAGTRVAADRAKRTTGKTIFATG